jgi:methylmalonyl-CoA mutase cobalamin-binding subunit
LVPQVIAELKKLGREDILVIAAVAIPELLLQEQSFS